MSELADTTEAPAATQAEDAPAADTPTTLATTGVVEEPAAPTDTDDAAPETEEVEGAPEEYEDFTAPEGIELDAEATTELKAIAKEFNLPQAKAQKLADLGASMLAKWNDQFSASVVQTRESWLATTKADPEIGGDKLAESTAATRRALDAYASPAFIKLLDETSLGNHPEVIRVFAKIGKTVSEDRVVTGARNPAPTGSLAERLYPSSKKE